MKLYRSKLAFGVLAAMAVGLTACGGSSGGGSTPADDDDTGPAGSSFQEDFSQTDRYSVIESPAGFDIDADTLAIITTEATSADFDAEVCTPANQCLTPASYFGAVDPDEVTPWWDGWTYRDSQIDGDLPGGDFHPLQAEIEGGVDLVPAGANDCGSIAPGLTAANNVDIFGVTYPVCVIRDGDIDGDFTLTNDHIYLLDGTVQVGNGDVEGAFDPATVRNDVLTIEPGTMIFAISETAPSLVITRGSEIDAVGTPDLPIIFAAVDVDNPEIDPMTITGDITDMGGRGRWGSLVLSGYGVVNNGDDNDQTTTEAVPDGVTRWFGGTDNDDSSGTLSYVLLLETGEAFRPDEEVQGLTIEASGGGTVINHVQVTNSDDDGIEWFGGAASADHVVIQGVSDDSLDIDLGYQGVIQNALVIMGEEFGDRGIESDNNGNNFGAEPKSSPIIANLTILGHFGNGGAADANTLGALHREGFGGQVYRAVYSDDSLRSGAFDLGCLDVDEELDEDLLYGDVIFNCSAGSLANDID